MLVTGLDTIKAVLDERLSIDSNLIIMGEDIGVYGGAFGATRGLLEKYGPEKIIDTPISEASFTGMATGMAMMGLHPIVEIMFMDFITLAYDQILNHAAKFNFMFNGQVNVPIIIRTPCGGGRGYGPSHSQSLGGLFTHIPGLTVMVPSSPLQMGSLLKAAFLCNHPVLFIENKLIYNQKEELSVDNSDQIASAISPGSPGKGRIIRQGTDITVFCYLNCVNLALAAADELSEKGIDIEIIDPGTLTPLDEDIIEKSINKTGRLFIYEEEYSFSSFGSNVAFLAANKCYKALRSPVEKLALPNMPIPAGKELEEMIMPDKDKLVKKISNIFNK